MRIETDYRVALGIPAVMIVSPIVGYYLLVAASGNRELALDSVTVAIPICAAAILRGVQQAPERTWSLEFGGLLGILVAIVAVGLRAISLLSNPGPLLYFTLGSTAVLGYVAHRMVRGLGRWVVPAPPNGT